MTPTINAIGSTDLMEAVRQMTQPQKTTQTFSIGSPIEGPIGATAAQESAPSFGDILTKLVNSVDSVQKKAQLDARNVMLGKTDNIHQAMLSMQEASVAFSMMSEVRNKLVGAYQELMRMQV